MKIIKTDFDGIFFIEPQKFFDHRGYFYEDFSEKSLKNCGIDFVLKQENISLSVKNVFRGMHFQENFPQAKIVSVISGKILDICLDIRENSPTFWKIFFAELLPDSPQLFIARGFAHGFLSLEDNTKISYKCDEFYVPSADAGIFYDYLPIVWVLQKYVKIEDLILSEKDKNLPNFENFLKNLWKF